MNWDFKLSGDQVQVLELIDQFEESWSRGGSDIQEFAAAIPSEHRSAVLHEVVKVDLENHWKNGERRRVAEYVMWFPELQANEGALLDLYRAEFAIRDRHGDTPSIAEYRELVPDFHPVDDTRGSWSEATVDPQATDPYQTVLPTTGPMASGPKIATINLGKYQVVSKLGEGGFGIVYRCLDEQLGRTVAIKVPRRQEEGFTSDMLHEAQTVAQLDHPNIVRMLGAETNAEGLGFLVYEFIDGVSLADRIEANDCSREQLVEWIAQIAEALHYAHRKNVFHRDVKPGNILIDRQGKAILVDFGMARRDGMFYTRDDGVVLGTLNYMPPEQVRGDADLANPETDLYSLGVVLYEALCGERPFQGKTFSELQRQIEHGVPRSPRSIDDTIPAGVTAVIEKALAKDPLQRIRAGNDFAAELRRAVRPQRGYELLVGVLAAVLVIAGLGVVWYSWPQPAETAPQPVAEIDTVDVYVNVENGTHLLLDKHLPLTKGESLQVDVGLNGFAHVYVFCWHPNGEATRIWPEATHDDLVDWASVKIKDIGLEPGASLILVGTTASPLSIESLETLTSTQLDWNRSSETLSRLESRYVIYDTKPTSMSERIAKRSEQESPTDFEISLPFKQVLSDHFLQHYGMIVSHQIAAAEGTIE